MMTMVKTRVKLVCKRLQHLVAPCRWACAFWRYRRHVSDERRYRDYIVRCSDFSNADKGSILNYLGTVLMMLMFFG